MLVPMVDCVFADVAQPDQVISAERKHTVLKGVMLACLTDSDEPTVMICSCFRAGLWP